MELVGTSFIGRGAGSSQAKFKLYFKKKSNRSAAMSTTPRQANCFDPDCATSYIWWGMEAVSA
jgi:hypothetical protein